MKRTDKGTGNYATRMELVEAVHGMSGTRQEVADATGISVGSVSRIMNPPPPNAAPLKLDDFWIVR
jgi:hypothetical protein